MRLAHTQPETRTGSVGDQGMWILVSRGGCEYILSPRMAHSINLIFLHHLRCESLFHQPFLLYPSLFVLYHVGAILIE
jgi:hypothetical protein